MQQQKKPLCHIFKSAFSACTLPAVFRTICALDCFFLHYLSRLNCENAFVNVQYVHIPLKVHKNENFFGFDFECCTISLLVMSKY